MAAASSGGPVLLAAAIVARIAIPQWRVRREGRRRHAAVVADVAVTADLLLLAASAGCTVWLAVVAAARHGRGPVAAALGRAVGEVEHGRRLGDALQAAASHLGDPARPLMAALAAADRYGGPLLPVLERVAGDARTAIRRQAEEQARTAPIALLFPLVLCILPAFGLLTVAPLIAGALRALRLG